MSCARCIENAFNEKYKKGQAPDKALIGQLAEATASDDELSLRVLNAVRADAATAPAAILAMVSLGVAALVFMVTTAISLTASDVPRDNPVLFWIAEAACIVVIALGGIWLYVRQSGKHRTATMWQAALEDALR